MPRPRPRVLFRFPQWPKKSLDFIYRLLLGKIFTQRIRGSLGQNQRQGIAIAPEASNGTSTYRERN